MSIPATFPRSRVTRYRDLLKPARSLQKSAACPRPEFLSAVYTSCGGAALYISKAVCPPRAWIMGTEQFRPQSANLFCPKIFIKVPEFHIC
ncbi:hypothetical protein BJX63DRAFT_364330 [Aspergillus granulosus]|uniref:Uncharacterized protein n=1 Tax=Aspergillus granulosus TaxID=176169 RepID=A0ABR4H1V0_9EURO